MLCLIGFSLGAAERTRRKTGCSVLAAREMEREPKDEGGGRGRGRRKPGDSENPAYQRTGRLIGSASRTLITCVGQRFVSY